MSQKKIEKMMCLCNVIGQANHFGSHKQFKFNLKAILDQVVNEILLKEKRSQCKLYIYIYAKFINMVKENLKFLRLATLNSKMIDEFRIF